MFTASDPGEAIGKAGVGTVLYIQDHGDDRPDWVTQDRSAWAFQAEGGVEAKVAASVAAEVKASGQGSSFAVITNLGINPAPFIALGITSVMVECYVQAGDYPYGNVARMRWQAKQEGWPHVIPVLGVFDSFTLQHYLDLNGGAKPFAKAHWKGGPLGIYLAEGMTDTGSWPTLASL
jgi:hypothetical protein